MDDEGNGAPLEEEAEVKPKPTRTRRSKKVTSSDVEKITAARRATKVAIRSLWPGKLVVNEDQVPSRSRYIFERSGSVVSVAEEDVETLLARQRNAGCCGSGQVGHFFELA